MKRDYAARADSQSSKRKRRRAGAAASTRSTRKTASQPSRRSQTDGGSTISFSAASFAAGALFGAALVALLPTLGDAVEDTVTATGIIEEAPPPKITFDFDDRLINDEVPVDLSAYPAEFEDLDESGQGRGSYLLQAASFTSFAEAADLQARLAGKDLPATISRVNVDDKPWYRVTVGPFSRQVEAQRAMTLLRENNLAPLPLKRG